MELVANIVAELASNMVAPPGKPSGGSGACWVVVALLVGFIVFVVLFLL